jgi:hypothetical protein
VHGKRENPGEMMIQVAVLIGLPKLLQVFPTLA